MRKKITCVLTTLLILHIFQMQSLAQSPSDVSPGYVVVSPGEGYKLGTGLWKLTTNQTGGSIAMCEFHNKDTTGWNWVPSHVHTREDEIWYVIEGELTFKINNEMRVAGPGSVVFGPRNVIHSYRISKAPVRYLLMLTPAGIDRLFLEVDSIGKRFPRGSTEFWKKIAPLSEKYGSYQPDKWDSLISVANLTNGTWELDIAASSFKPGPGWKKQTRIYTSAGAAIKMIGTGTRDNGDTIRFEYTGAYDGKDYPVSGNAKVETLAQELVDKYTVKTITKREGRITATSVRVISQDGKTMTITTSGIDEKGVAFDNKLILHKKQE